jgi:hypothetical protein
LIPGIPRKAFFRGIGFGWTKNLHGNGPGGPGKVTSNIQAGMEMMESGDSYK